MRAQIAYAAACGLPVVFHQREAFDAFTAVLRAVWDRSTMRGIMHCFTGNAEEARTFVDEFGLMLGIGGVITFKTADPLRAAVRAVGLDAARARDGLSVSGARAVSRQAQRTGVHARVGARRGRRARPRPRDRSGRYHRNRRTPAVRRGRAVNAGTALPESQHGARCLIFNGDAAPKTVDDLNDISDVLAGGEHFVWFDIAQPSADDLAVLQREFNLHPMAIEDASLWHERPKIEFFDDYVLVIVHGASLDPSGALVTHEIAIFAGSRFVVTIRATPLYPLDEIEKRWKTKINIPHTSTGLLYTILDVIVDDFFPLTTAYDERLVRLEAHLFDDEDALERTEREIFRFKRALSIFRGIAAPMREILGRLTHTEVRPLEPGLGLYFRDVQDHVLRAIEQIETTRDLLNSTFDLHLSTQSHRQAQVGKQLTIIATIFLPLTYVTGFFGQNFGWMVNNIGSPWIFWLLGVGTQLFALAILFWYFRKKGYF